MRTSTSTRYHRVAFALPLLLALGMLPGCDFFASPGRSDGDGTITVMTRNLYIGTDLNIVVGATTPAEIPVRVAQFYANVQATNFAERAEALADEIERDRPYLIGLQEVALYRIQAQSDYVQGVTTPNATDVAIDFLEVLQEELNERRLPYNVINESVNVDAELPGAVSATEFFDLRLTLKNVILARPFVRATSSESGIYQAQLTVTVGGAAPVSLPRSYGWVDAVALGRTFRFVNTHLETEAAPPIQEAQANELLQLLDDFDGAIVLVGDYNSAADGSTTATYERLTSRFSDAFSATNGTDPGYTCCEAADLRNSASMLDRRIDLILYGGGIEAESAHLVGHMPADRTPSGLWPSDHAGVVAAVGIE